jgi:hypothetical protein
MIFMRMSKSLIIILKAKYTAWHINPHHKYELLVLISSITANLVIECDKEQESKITPEFKH